MELPNSLPRINFSKLKSVEAAKPVFDPNNILLFSGHGIEYINSDRHPLGENQYALIPGGCGLKIQAPSASVYKQFFDFKDNLNVFNKKSKNQNISSTLGIQYLSSEENAEGANSPKETSQLFKCYFPGAANTYRGTIPSMIVSPLMTEKTQIDDRKFLRIELSGILRKTEPVLFPPGPNLYDTEYVRFIEYDDADLEKPLSESPITESIKAALAGSLLTFNDMLVLMNRTEEDATVSEMINHTIYLPNIFNFISTKVNGPFLLIVLTCRESAKPAVPQTPSRRNAVKQAREEIIAKAGLLRRQSSAGLRLQAPLLFMEAKSGVGLGAIGSGGVGLGPIGLGGRRRTSAKRHLVQSKRFKRRTIRNKRR
jgi:hypothetical protein